MEATDFLHPRDNHSSFIFYRYDPSLAAAIIFAVLFAAVTSAHLVHAIRFRTGYFTPFIVGGCFEIVGYVGRIASHFARYSLGPFITQSIFLLVAPAFFAASIYMVLGRIIRFLDGERYSMIRVQWLTKIFVTGDVFSFFVQAGGAGIASGGASKYELGHKIIIAGLCLQIVIFGFFVISAIVFQRRIQAHPTVSSSDPKSQWRRHLTVLYLVSALILLRSVVRVVEYAHGNDGWIIAHEVMLYLFDALLMLGLVVVLFIVHPDQLLSQQRELPSSEGSLALQELHQPKK
ncbi:hypothetical protein LTR66_006412 [Elasticomyces elasticus]|nr:hypothetical protein LTR28_003129 [Elasticomyces elasticus]KAK4991958.1 hypothetical protein LTR66_006412 [Elasticomyces elasticus]